MNRWRVPKSIQDGEIMKSNTELDKKKKTVLSEYLEMKSELNYWEERVAEAEQLNTYRSPSASRTPSKSAPGDPTGTALAMLETAKENKKRAEERSKEAMGRVLAIIQTVPKATHRIILMRRYIDGLSLDDIAEAEYKSRTWVVTTLKAAVECITL